MRRMQRLSDGDMRLFRALVVVGLIVMAVQTGRRGEWIFMLINITCLGWLIPGLWRDWRKGK